MTKYIPCGDYSEESLHLSLAGKLQFIPENAEVPENVKLKRVIHLLREHKDGCRNKWNPVTQQFTKRRHGPACNPKLVTDPAVESLTTEVAATTCYDCLAAVLSSEQLQDYIHPLFREKPQQ